ncbi:glutamine--tRNA ligase/YqeY domain fusion protein [bacterium endosymbiont of Bathymodiolus sp. 5 South]|jgi:glutaminyl-tRNA synthetase|uniref:glutamine--tRNA ligase/YqeY domain fusion protein n=1 Tax=bacterium endosymbiont of Bathymodiolus sp. 5 South TaxID=1181670 RepID=UPI0010B0D9B7|nr:glutamine--tRNA ligase/YqeY domain fusion protein [bacterium endosymbiont of Bathymodiolus sp. 5 South]VVH55682.1 Glutaminyl-tRNA synthetase (EC [uncultured Gammaproteobacteria bacterium]SHN92517.1 Glutaminyl-tRNA synthetase [bacterium endosymbiont of Bathymodiolus sp. 5 South]SSC08170.1 Glutaminyl-tRNA synthetase [bacterium endosymbiont of Bathymodiolus sp. 5 South]VVH62450.1 Glutaminyl-tRNA synthetase (EC [uncultured Gammaproteobacteria bacterium]VVM18816.1 Glutaminyl-tRNA synthetase (EC 
MSDNNPTEKPINFIRHQINEDLDSGLHSTIQTRFPPEPNGYLHIGHAKSICLNFGLVQDYKGRCNLRFDDTNPAKEDVEFIESIKNDVKWLGFEWDGEIQYSSNYFTKFYKYAIELINKELAYVCFLNAEQTREYRGTLKQAGTDSPYRNTSVAQNLELLAKMKEGKFSEGECVLRAKINMASPFMCLRDPALYRIRFEKHHQTGNEWRIYPMYDFAHCISDAIEGVTHSLCTLEFQDNRRLYDWILEHLEDFNKPNRPHQYEFSRLNLEYTVMSKRKLQQLVEDALVLGWNDPRLPTISGLRRRGYTPASIRDFVERIGISKVDSMTDMKILEDAVRDDLNIVAPRTMGVIDPIKVIIENYPEKQVETLKAPIHPQNEDKGKRDIFFSQALYIDRADFEEVAPNKKFKRLAVGKEVRLRNAYVINATSFDTDFDGNVTTVYATYDAHTLGKNPTDGRKVKGVIHFVEASTALKAEFRLYDRLFTLENPGKNDHFEQLLNPKSLVVTYGIVEPSMKDAKPELAYQFEREGYFCRDSEASDSLVFNKTVALRDTWGN